MINIKELMLGEADGFWDKLRIQLGIGVPAEYACRNLQEFLANRNKMKKRDLVLLPKLFYFPKARIGESFLEIPVSLEDESARIDALVSYTAINRRGGGFIADSLKYLCGGETICNPIIRNGIFIPSILVQGAQSDDNIYLVGFETFGVVERGEGLSDILSKLESLLPEFNLTKPFPVPAG